MLPTDEEKKKARVLYRSPSISIGLKDEKSVILDIPERTTDHNGRLIEINKPIIKNAYDLPEILFKKCQITVGEISTREIIPSSLPAYANRSHISDDKT